MTTFIVPGVFGSDTEHWQTWMEAQLDDAKRIHQKWDQPCLPVWSENLIRALDQTSESVWLIAHSFGCLVSAIAGAARPSKVAGALFVAPADPARFSTTGFFDTEPSGDSIVSLLPHQALSFPMVVVASENDPWVKLTTAAYWAHKWGGLFTSIGKAGHINVHSGYGPWPWGLELYRYFRLLHDGSSSYGEEGALLMPSSVWDRLELGIDHITH